MHLQKLARHFLSPSPSHENLSSYLFYDLCVKKCFYISCKITPLEQTMFQFHNDVYFVVESQIVNELDQLYGGTNS